VGEPGSFSVGPSLVTTGNIFDVAGTAGFEKESFDLITAFCVFEHLPNLDKYVKVLRSLMKPGGHMVIGLPNVKSWNARLSGKHWNQYLLEHLWYFDRKTTRKFMEREGFRETRYRSAAYDAPVAHIVRRVAQTYGLPTPHFGLKLSNIVVPVPIGLMYGVFQLG
jgi:SAM-dependent methyltransferase